MGCVSVSRPFLLFPKSDMDFSWSKPYKMQSEKFTVIIHQFLWSCFLSLIFYFRFFLPLCLCRASPLDDRSSQRAICVTAYSRVRCACVIYDYRSHYDVKSTTMCGINFRMCETITNKNTRMLISLSLNVYYPAVFYLFLFALPAARMTPFAQALLVCACVHFMRIAISFG